MTAHLPPERRAAEVNPACLGTAICQHWQVARVTGFMADTLSALLGGVQATRITHYRGEPKVRTWLSSDPLVTCADGHRLELEQWVHEVMAAEGCTPGEPPAEPF